MKHAVLILAFAVALASGSAVAADAAGPARAITSDQIAIGTARINLFGIDAPDPDQDNECTAGRAFYGCASNAKRALEILVSLGPVECTDSGVKNFIGIAYMTCTIRGADVGADLVRQGWALAFRLQSDKYVPLEEEAKAKGIGLWQPSIQFTKPWEWRQMDGKPVLGP
ncbi:MAG: thermonuclease family protein [Alphaproteobacteria bacterium]|nr:thermonuclease family protein [Alphaproteobacteria bacterium]